MHPVSNLISFASRRTFWSEGHVFAIAPEQLGIAEGLRAATGIAVMLGISILLQMPDLAFGVIAFFWTCLCDPGGPNRNRVKLMAWFGVVTTAVITLASYGAHWGDFWGGVFLFALVFSCCLTRSYTATLGPAPAQGGLIAAVGAVVGVATDRDLAGALQLGGYFFLGATWAIVLSIYLWPNRPETVARRTLLAIFSRLDEMIRELVRLDDAQGGNDVRWLRFDTRYEHAARLSIERGRQTIDRMERNRDRYSVGIDSATELLAAIVAMAHERRRAVLAYDADTDRPLLEDLSTSLCAVIEVVKVGTADCAECSKRLWSLKSIANARRPRVGPLAAYAAKALIRFVDRWRCPRDETIYAVESVRLPALSFTPLVLRHAARVSVAVSASYVVGIWLDIPFWFWGAIATLVVIQPLPGNTWLRVLERAAGGVVGEAAAAVFVTTLTSPTGMMFAIVPLSVGVISLRLVNYGLFVVFLTPMFIMLSDYIQPSDGLILSRLLNEILGACFGIAAAFILWPEKEVDEIPGLISAAVRSVMSLASAALEQKSQPPADFGALRRESGLASTRVETARERLWLQGRWRAAKLEVVRDVAAALRCVCGASIALGIRGSGVPDAIRAKHLQRMSLALQGMSSGKPSKAAIPIDESDDDLAAAVNLLAKSLQRYAN